MKKVIIVAGGKSIREEWLNNGLFDNIKGQTIWSLNYAYKTMPYFPTRQMWVDREQFFSIYKEELFYMYDKGVELVTQRAGFIPLPQYSKYITKNYTKVRKYEEQFENEHLVYTGRYSLVGLFALSVALKEGYDTLFLLGFDWGTSTVKDKDTHYYQGFIKHSSEGVGDSKIYRESNDKLNDRVKDFSFYQESKAKIYNVNLKSNIEYFEKITYEKMYELIKD